MYVSPLTSPIITDEYETTYEVDHFEEIGKGYEPRDYEKEPEGTLEFATPFPRNLYIPRDQWRDRIEQMEKDKATLSDVRQRASIPTLSQGRTNYCFQGDTLVRMADGSQKPIKDVKLLDEVLTAEGNIGKVVKTIVNHIDEPMVRLKLWGHSHLVATTGHPILTEDGYVPIADLKPGDKVAIPKYIYGKTTKISIWDLLLQKNYGSNAQRVYQGFQGKNVRSEQEVGIPGKQKVVIVKNPVPDSINLTHGFGRLIGLYLAEGHTSAYATYWSFNKNEEHTLAQEVVDILKNELDCDVNVRIRDNVCQVCLHGRFWPTIFEELCGRGSKNKELNQVLTGGPKEFLEGVISGWIDGDRQVNNYGVTISKDLALNMFDIANSLNLMPAISIHDKGGIKKDGILRQTSWKVGWGGSGGVNNGRKQDNTHLWRPVKELEYEDFSGYVYNLEVEGDNSYVAEGIGVHNCWSFGTVNCVRILRAKMGLPFANLSPTGPAAQIKNFRNVGGNTPEIIRWLAQNGVPEVKYWPLNQIDRRYVTDDMKKNAAQYKLVDWYELPRNDFNAMMSCLLLGIPVACGFMWWRHLVAGLSPKALSNGFGIEIENSWGNSWGNNGLGTLEESKATAFDQVAPIVFSPYEE